MPAENFSINGLSDDEVISLRQKHGLNKLNYKKENDFADAIKALVKEPMVILLFAASAIHFVSGKTGDGIFLATAIILVSAISLYQDRRSRNALAKLKIFTQPFCKVIRNGNVVKIQTEELVPGDSMILEEGEFVPADGIIVHSNDFSVNESILTGEAFTVYKNKDSTDNHTYSGTIVASGLAIATVTHTGNETRLGKIGKSLESIAEEKTPLETQISGFVKKMVIAGAIVFVIVWLINYSHSRDILDSLLKALTLAMSILPEEIPVAFSTFMAIGAWRLMKMGILVKQMKTVETLGSATVICTDKTGTLTENKMSIGGLFLLTTGKVFQPGDALNEEENQLIELAMWASEPIPFDPMEIELHNIYKKIAQKDNRPYFKIIHEYPLGGKPPMMTHIFEDESGNRIIAAKGAPEALLAISNLAMPQVELVNKTFGQFAKEGYRVLAVANADFPGNNFPVTQQEFSFMFKGLVAFFDPPKKNIREVLRAFYKAGISVKIITGDTTETTAAISKQIGFEGYEKSISGDELIKLGTTGLRDCVKNTNSFTRMFPEAKLAIINALKENGEVVAMTGDGVNDGPALKAAHIGIAMGSRGTEIAKEAASLILVEDDLSKMVDAIEMGRKIYANLKKAIQYIISIHIPIILTVFIPLALGWVYPNIFSPVHIIFFELIMGPTCSIIYENEPIEKNLMFHKPRLFTKTFFNWTELGLSIMQGLVITAGTLFIYQYAVGNGYNEALTRTMCFTVLITANIFLTLVNRSFYYSLFTTLKYRNNLILLIIIITTILVGLLIYVKPLASFFGFMQLDTGELMICFVTGLVSATWYEGVKFFKRMNKQPQQSVN